MYRFLMFAFLIEDIQYGFSAVFNRVRPVDDLPETDPEPSDPSGE